MLIRLALSCFSPSKQSPQLYLCRARFLIHLPGFFSHLAQQVKKLIEAGVDPNARDPDGMTALHQYVVAFFHDTDHRAVSVLRIT